MAAGALAELTAERRVFDAAPERALEIEGEDRPACVAETIAIVYG